MGGGGSRTRRKIVEDARGSEDVRSVGEMQWISTSFPKASVKD